MTTHLRISINLEETHEEPEDQYHTVIILKKNETPKSSLGQHGKVLQSSTISIEGREEDYEAIVKLGEIFDRPFVGLMELLLLRGFQEGIKYAAQQILKPKQD